MAKWSVNFMVCVPAYGSITVEANTADEAERIAMLHHETGEDSIDFEVWESRAWHDSGPLECLWGEAEDFEITSVTEATNETRNRTEESPSNAPSA